MSAAVADVSRAPRSRLGGIPLDLLDMGGCLDLIEELARSARSAQVATVNLDFLVLAQEDPWLRSILNRTSLNLVDGMPLVWMLRGLGVEVPERVAGSDLVPALATRLARCGGSLYLLGGEPEVTQRAAAKLLDDNPGLRIVGIDSPPRAAVAELGGAVVERIRRARPDVLLVAFGNPKQEQWLDTYLGACEVPVALGVGGTLDFLAGRRRRAPRWMQRAGLEWTARLVQEPARLAPRYARDAVALPRLLGRELLLGGRLV